MDRGTKAAVLVTGGAGFIGAHTAKALHDRGYLPVVYDSLSSGFREAVRWGPLVHGDIRDPRTLSDAMAEHDVKAVIHFAGLIEVGRFAQKRGDPFEGLDEGGEILVLVALADFRFGKRDAVPRCKSNGNFRPNGAFQVEMQFRLRHCGDLRWKFAVGHGNRISAAIAAYTVAIASSDCPSYNWPKRFARKSRSDTCS